VEEETPKGGNASRPRTHRWLRRIVLAWVGFGGLAFVSLAIMPWILSPDWCRQKLVTALTEALGTDVQIAAFDYQPFSGFSLEGLQVGAPKGFRSPVLSLERLDVRYRPWALLRGEIVIESILLKRPVVRTEFVEGVSGMQALFAPAETSTKTNAPSRSRLPVRLVLESGTLGPLRWEYEDGPRTGFVDSIFLQIAGNTDLQDFDVRSELSLRPGDESAPSSSAETVAPNLFMKNFRSDVSEESVSGRMHLLVSMMARGQLGDRARLEDVRLALETRSQLWRDASSSQIDRTGFAMTASAALSASDPSKNHAECMARLDDETILASRLTDFSVSEGLVKAFRTHIDVLEISLDKLAPWAKMWSSEMSASGRVRSSPFVLAYGQGTGLELLSSPELVFDDVSLAWSQAMALSRLDGRLRSPTPEKAGRRTIDGALRFQGMRIPGTRVGPGRVSLEVSSDPRLDLETVQGRLAVELDSLVANGANLDHPRLSIELGVPPKTPDLSDKQIRVHLAAASGSMGKKARFRAFRGDLGVRLALLLAPGTTPMGVEGSFGFHELQVNDTTIARPMIRVSGNFSDPRNDPAWGGEMDLTWSARSLSMSKFLSQSPSGQLVLQFDDVRPRVLWGRPVSAAPAQVSVSTKVRTSRFSAKIDSSTWVHQDDAVVRGRFRWNGQTDAIEIHSIRADVGAIGHVQLQGNARHISGGNPAFELEVYAGPVDLGALWSTVPPALVVEKANLTLSGTVSADVHLSGVWRPQRPLSAVEAKGSVRVAALHVRSGTAEVKALSGSLGATYQPALGLSAFAKFSASKLGFEAAEFHNAALDASLAYSDKGLALDLRGDAQGNGFEDQTPSQASRSSVSLGVSYSPWGALVLDHLALSMPDAGLEVDAKAQLLRGRYGVLRPRGHLQVRANMDRLAKTFRGWDGRGGAVAFGLRLQPAVGVEDADDTLVLSGDLALDKVSMRMGELLEVGNAHGTLRMEQGVFLPPAEPPSERPKLGVFGDDLEARLEELSGAWARSKLWASTESILGGEASTADREALRPYYAKHGSLFRADRIRFRDTRLEDVLVEASWDSGVLKFDRLQARVWEGDFVGAGALQIDPKGAPRFRLQATMTQVNFDVPYARARGILPVSEEDEKALYRASGTIDLQVAFRERAIDARMEFTELSKALVERVLGIFDSRPDNPTVALLDKAETVGIRVVGSSVWISSNLLNVGFSYERLWPWSHIRVRNPLKAPLGAIGDIFLWVGRVVTIPTLGAAVVANLNGAIRRVSVSNFLDRSLYSRLVGFWSFLDSRVRAAPGKVQGMEGEASSG
jgi:hypothetical protein